MPITTFYLDTNAYCEFVDHPERYNSTVERMRAGVDAGRCRILGSPSVLEELLCIPDDFAAKRRTAFELFWESVGTLVLRNAEALFIDEIRKGSQLKLGEAILPPQDSAEFRNLTLTSRSCAITAREIKTEEQNVAEQFQDTVNAAHKALIDEYGTESNARTMLSGLTIDESRVQSWHEHIFQGYQSPTRVLNLNSRPVCVANLPVTRAFVSFFLARVRRHHAQVSKVRRGDRDDAMHYSSAAMGDALVTSDRTLKRIAESIEWKPIRVLNLTEFRKSLSGPGEQVRPTG